MEINKKKGGGIMEKKELLSVCCTAPPMYEIHEGDATEWEAIGICSQCKENATFKDGEDE